MNWREARDGTLRQWTAIRDALEQADPVYLLTEINAVCGLCEKSDQEAGNPFERCRYCLFYQQFGGCQEFSGDLSERVADKDWEGARWMIDDMIEKLSRLELPGSAAAA